MIFYGKTFSEKQRERKGARYDADMRKFSAGVVRCNCELCNVTEPDLHWQLLPLYTKQMAQDVPNRLFGTIINYEGDAV